MRAFRLVGAALAATFVLTVPASGAGAATTAAGETGIPEDIDYVALGDSFTSGPFMATQRTDPVGCLRSTNNYPAFLAGYFQVRTYRDVSCSGADTADVTGPQALVDGSVAPPQIEALSDDTDFVTIGLGGNDFNLYASLVTTCLRAAPSDPTGAPCQAAFTDANGVDTKARDAKAIEANVAGVIDAVKQKAPNAQIYVVGYPWLLPRDGSTCPEAPFAAGDYPWINEISLLTNRSVRKAAESREVGFLRLARVYRGHDICAGDNAWINGKDRIDGVAEAFHPVKQGMRGAARTSYRQITGWPAPLYPDPQPPAGSIVPNPV
jgi:lysophospholipase L1-like esterase